MARISYDTGGGTDCDGETPKGIKQSRQMMTQILRAATGKIKILPRQFNKRARYAEQCVNVSSRVRVRGVSPLSTNFAVQFFARITRAVLLAAALAQRQQQALWRGIETRFLKSSDALTSDGASRARRYTPSTASRSRGLFFFPLAPVAESSGHRRRHRAGHPYFLAIVGGIYREEDVHSDRGVKAGDGFADASCGGRRSRGEMRDRLRRRAAPRSPLRGGFSDQGGAVVVPRCAGDDEAAEQQRLAR